MGTESVDKTTPLEPMDLTALKLLEKGREALPPEKPAERGILQSLAIHEEIVAQIDGTAGRELTPEIQPCTE